MRAVAALTVSLAFLLAACVTAPPPAAPASPAAGPAKATESAAAEKPLALMGKFSLSPDHGPWDTAVIATATDLRPTAKYDLVWTTVEGSWKLSADRTEYKGREYRPVQKVLASVTTDAKGSFRASFAVPSEFGFQHDVLVLDEAKEVRNKAGFDVDMQVSISPSSGPAGTPITIEAKGIGWRQLQNSWLVSYDNAFTGWLSAVTTKGYAKAVIPATGRPGTHVITVLHGDFTFPYLNMQQSPEPGRPQFRIPFTVTEGPAVLPPDVAVQTLPVLRGKGAEAATAVWAEPAEGIVGSVAVARGRGLPPDAALELTWSTTVGNRVSGSGWEDKVKPFAKVRTDAKGEFKLAFAVPDDLGGTHLIAAKSGEKELAQGQFVITPSAAKLPVDRGPSGTEVTIHLKGVGWTETANIYHLVYDNAYAGYACGFNSGGDVQITFRVSGDPGWHYLDLYPGIYKGVEIRPLNFRIPQLTYADDHPGERLPAFHFAFLITAP